MLPVIRKPTVALDDGVDIGWASREPVVDVVCFLDADELLSSRDRGRRLRRGGLHAVGQFVRCDACFQVGVALPSAAMPFIEPLCEVERATLIDARQFQPWAKIVNARVARLDVGVADIQR